MLIQFPQPLSYSFSWSITEPYGICNAFGLTGSAKAWAVKYLAQRLGEYVQLANFTLYSVYYVFGRVPRESTVTYTFNANGPHRVDQVQLCEGRLELDALTFNKMRKRQQSCNCALEEGKLVDLSSCLLRWVQGHKSLLQINQKQREVLSNISGKLFSFYTIQAQTTSSQPLLFFAILSSFQQVAFYESLLAAQGKTFQELWPQPFLLIYRENSF